MTHLTVEKLAQGGRRAAMTAQSAGHESMSTSGWQLTPRCYNTSYRVAAFRALVIALILAAGLAFLILF
ncbi:hypothetical protein BST43_20740 [Mycobacteroides saopaulense]|uniref:Uncharacterized protein n=1 Tax=Mycobacteroides saopaulense TaxID=1578165 RepID=A0A1X0IU05_9MYCO|nr:hypothetical protein BST43_20740 [Mycobacteroides saopaulense]